MPSNPRQPDPPLLRAERERSDTLDRTGNVCRARLVALSRTSTNDSAGVSPRLLLARATWPGIELKAYRTAICRAKRASAAAAGAARRRAAARASPRPRRTPKTTRSRRPSRPRRRGRRRPGCSRFENVARRPQPTSERSGYETVRVVAARATPTPRTGAASSRSATAATPAACSKPPTVDAGQPLESTVGTLLRLHGARVVVDRTHAPPRRGRDRGRAAVFGLALTCADLEPVDNAAIEADDEQRPDVDADGHVSALLRASAGRATLRAAAATLDEHQPGGAAATEDAGLLGMDVAPLRALVAAVAPAPAPARRIPRRSPARRAAPAPAPARPPPARRTPRNSPQRRRTPRTPASPPPPLPQPRGTPRVPPTPGLDAPMRATAERLVAEQRAAEAAEEAEDEEWLFSPAAPGHAPSPAQLPRPRLADRAPARKPLARAKRRPISILPLRYDPRKRAAPEPAPAPTTGELWQRPAPAPTAGSGSPRRRAYADGRAWTALADGRRSSRAGAGRAVGAAAARAPGRRGAPPRGASRRPLRRGRRRRGRTRRGRRCKRRGPARRAAKMKRRGMDLMPLGSKRARV